MLYDIWFWGAVITTVIILSRLIPAWTGILTTPRTDLIRVKFIQLWHDGYSLFGKYHWAITIPLVLLLLTVFVVIWPITYVMVFSSNKNHF